MLFQSNIMYNEPFPFFKTTNPILKLKLLAFVLPFVTIGWFRVCLCGIKIQMIESADSVDGCDELDSCRLDGRIYLIYRLLCA